MVRASVSPKNAMQVPITRAASAEGRNLRIRQGQKMQIAKAADPAIRSWGLPLAIASGQAAIWTNGPPRDGLSTKDRRNLENYDDHANPGHKTRNHLIWRVTHKAADPEKAHGYLYQAGQHDDDEGRHQVVGIQGDDCSHGDRHWTGGTGDLRRRATERGGKEAHCDETVDSGSGLQPRGNPES